MPTPFLKLIQTGATAEVAAAVHDDPTLATWRDPQGVSALLWSVYCGQSLVRDFLLTVLKAQFIDPDIFEAAAIGDEKQLAALIAANPGYTSAFSGDGWTALHLAAAFGTPAAVALLLKAGASVAIISRNPQQNKPLHAALALGRNSESINLLLAHGADANATQAGGFTPLFSAATSNRQDLVEILLAHGANPHQKSDAGKTAADFARERGHTNLATWLESQPQT